MSSTARRLGGKIGTFVLVAALLGLLAASVWLAVRTWISVGGPALPTQGYVAMALGILFSVVIGCGLMALDFYSSRYGYDDQSHQDQHTGRDDGRDSSSSSNASHP